MLHIFLWKWRQEGFREVYTAQHVNIIANQLRMTITEFPKRIICVTDDPAGIEAGVECVPLWKDHDGVANATGKHLPSCYRRLKLFDFATQKELGCRPGDRLISLDLDSILVRPFNDVLHRVEQSGAHYAGWAVRGTYHPRVYNGSFWSIKCSDELQHVWSTFDPVRSPREYMQKGYLGSDQGWMSYHFAKSEKSYGIAHPYFASYPREIRRTGAVDKNTRIVFFHGARKPWHVLEQRQQPWIARYWKES